MAKVNNEVEYTISLRDLLGNKIKNATQDTNKLNQAVTGVKSNLASIGGALGIGVGIAGVVRFGSAVIDSLKNYEYFSASLRTLMRGDAETAKALETQLISLAAKTPFSLVEVQDATKQLLAYGFAAGEVTKNISMLGDVASALKIPFSDIAYLYGTLKTQGRAFTRDIMQFTSRGIPIIKELSKQFGVTEAEVMKLVEAGKVGFPQVEMAFKNMTAEGGMFFNMMAQQSKTVGGQISNLGDSWEQLKVNIGKSQTGIIAETVSFANSFVSTIGNMFKRSNEEAEYFAKYGAEKFSLWEKFNLTENSGLGNASEFARFQNTLNKMYVDAPAKTLTEAKNKFNELRNLLRNQKVAFDKGEIDLTEYKRNRALILGTSEKVKGNFELLAKKPEKPTVDANGKPIATTSAIETVKASAPKATTINISYGSLNLNQDIKVMSAGSDFKNKVGDSTAEALLNAVNDVNRIAATQ